MSILPLKFAPSVMLTGRRKNIPADFCRLLHEYGFLGLQVAVHRPFHNDELRFDIGLDRALGADGQTLCKE